MIFMYAIFSLCIYIMHRNRRLNLTLKICVCVYGLLLDVGEKRFARRLHVLGKRAGRFFVFQFAERNVYLAYDSGEDGNAHLEIFHTFLQYEFVIDRKWRAVESTDKYRLGLTVGGWNNSKWALT